MFDWEKRTVTFRNPYSFDLWVRYGKHEATLAPGESVTFDMRTA